MQKIPDIFELIGFTIGFVLKYSLVGLIIVSVIRLSGHDIALVFVN